MGKMIIDNQTDLTDSQALELAAAVIRGGRVSNNDTQYCYGTTFDIDGETYMVSTDLNKKSDKFYVYDVD